MNLEIGKVYRASPPQWGKPYLLKLAKYIPKANLWDVGVYSFYYRELSKNEFDERFTLEYLDTDIDSWLEEGWMVPYIKVEDVKLDEDLFTV